MKLKLILLLVVCCCTHLVSAQTVDPLSGRLQFSIPLGGIQANDVAVPISIYNHGDAIRVAEGEGACGMGWGLSIGGGVSRMVRGLPDDINLSYRKGWLYNSNAQ